MCGYTVKFIYLARIILNFVKYFIPKYYRRKNIGWLYNINNSMLSSIDLDDLMVAVIVVHFFKTITCQFIILHTFYSQMVRRQRWNRVNIRLNKTESNFCNMTNITRSQYTTQITSLNEHSYIWLMIASKFVILSGMEGFGFHGCVIHSRCLIPITFLKLNK